MSPLVVSMTIPYDESWKAVVEALVYPFIAHFFPDIFIQLDPTFTPRFVEQEMRARIKGKAHKIVDKLLLVRLLDGEFRLVLIHIEFESHPSDIAKRMFDYYCLIKDVDVAKLFPDLVSKSSDLKKQQKMPFAVTSLVVYVGNNVPAIPDRYEVEAFGTSVVFRFNTYSVRDQSEEALHANSNPFAVVTLANKYVNETIGDDEKRLTLKEMIFKLANERGYDEATITALLFFNDGLMCLPPNLEKQYLTYINDPQIIAAMPYIAQSSINFAEAVAKNHFGRTYSELTESLSAKDSTIAAKDSAIAAKNAATIKTILRLY